MFLKNRQQSPSRHENSRKHRKHAWGTISEKYIENSWSFNFCLWGTIQTENLIEEPETTILNSALNLHIYRVCILKPSHLQGVYPLTLLIDIFTNIFPVFRIKYPWPIGVTFKPTVTITLVLNHLCSLNLVVTCAHNNSESPRLWHQAKIGDF